MAGIIHNDRELGARVRRLTLRKIEAVLKGDDEEFKKAVILKLSSSILPRINEHSGEGGEAIKLVIDKINYIIPDGADTSPNTQTAPSVSSTE
mgnify:CR=1 FL=1